MLTDNILAIILLLYFILVETHWKKHVERPSMLHVRSLLLFKRKIIARDHRSRHPQTGLFCCVLIDGDAHIIIKMNFSRFIRNPGRSSVRVKFFVFFPFTSIHSFHISQTFSQCESLSGKFVGNCQKLRADSWNYSIKNIRDIRGRRGGSIIGTFNAISSRLSRSNRTRTFVTETFSISVKHARLLVQEITTF